MTHWSNRYIGIPFVLGATGIGGCSCWGLAVLIYQEELGIRLPMYGAASDEDARHLADMVTQERESGDWVAVEQTREFDVLLFRSGRWTVHVGIALNWQRMLHVPEGQSSRIEHRGVGTGWASRFAGAYRHRELVGVPL